MKTTFYGHPGMETPRERTRSIALAFLLILLGGSLGFTLRAHAETRLRVGTSGDYAPYSVLRTQEEGAGQYHGLGPRLAQAFAQDRGFEVEFVSFRWPELLEDLKEGRFDVAMSGVTIRPERSVEGRFSLPITTSGAMILVPDASPFVTIRELDEPEFKLAVNAGGHLERVTRKHFQQARILPMQENQDVIRVLAEGQVDAAITDTREAAVWQERYPGLRAIGPFTRDRKAFLIHPDQTALAREIDAWLLETELDGRLEGLRTEELGPSSDPTRSTEPLRALLAAVDERLSLMPWVAEAKRKTGGPVEVPEVERRVLADALIRFQAAQNRNPTSNPRKDEEILDFYRAQIEAAKTIQRRILASSAPSRGEPIPDLTMALRPALLRINDRVANLLVALPDGISEQAIRNAAEEELISTNLPEKDREAIAQALIALMSPKPAP